MIDKQKIKQMIYYMLIIIGFTLVVFIIYDSAMYKIKQSKLTFSTQYTYSVRIDADGKELGQDEEAPSSETATDFPGIEAKDMAQIWMKSFTTQFTQPYVPKSKGLRDVHIDKISVLDSEHKIVKVGFSAELLNSESDYFASWGGYISEGRLTCEWIISFELDDLYDNTARIFINDIQMPQDYSASAYKKEEKATAVSTAKVQSSAASSMYQFEIKSEKVMITYDGGEKWSTVPVDYDDFMSGRKKDSTIKEGAYQITNEKAAFIYGGMQNGNQNVPLTVIYSDDKGVNWTSTVVSSSLTTVDYMYVKFENEKNGTIVVGYKASNQETSAILSTTDGGETWNEVGRGPINTAINSVSFFETEVGFISYQYDEDVPGNLYMTRDGGITFTQVNIQSQNLNDLSGKYTWDMVYKDIQTPLDSGNGTFYLLVNQTGDVNYDGNSTSARYESTDKGLTWKYAKIVERSNEKEK